MANKEALRALQHRLAERLQEARSTLRGRSWLAVECGGRGFLFPLKEAGEIFPMTVLAPVSHAHPWFLGVANLRGHLHGVVDLAGFFGMKSATENRDQAMLVAFNASLDVNAALLVDRLAGLRGEEQLFLDSEPSVGHPSFVGQCLRDVDGRVWQEISLAHLVRHEAFLKIVG
jgi:twitching motility protein PilI